MGTVECAVRATRWKYARGVMVEAWWRTAKSTGRRLWGERVAWARRGPEGEERIETWVRGRRGSGWYEAPLRCMWPRLRRLTGTVGEKEAEFISLVVGRQKRRPRCVTAQEPPTPPIEKVCGSGERS